jgi:hypothetical protein
VAAPFLALERRHSVKKIIVEIPLSTRLRPDALREAADAFRVAVTNALATCRVGEDGAPVHVADGITLRVEEHEDRSARLRVAAR